MQNNQNLLFFNCVIFFTIRTDDISTLFSSHLAINDAHAHLSCEIFRNALSSEVHYLRATELQTESH